MNTENGNLRQFGEKEFIPDNFVEVSENDMTKKQKKNKKVSLKDHKSKLGKKLTEERGKRKIQNNEECICGSGKKFKKCCKFK